MNRICQLIGEIEKFGRKVQLPLFLDGYVYYDLFNQILGSNMVQLVSPLITSGDDTQLCFSFWYAAFGAGDSAVMQIIRQDNSSGESITDKVLYSFSMNLKAITQAD